MPSKDKTHEKLVKQAFLATPAVHLNMLEAAGYELTDVGGETMWKHRDGRDDCTVWVEIIEGRATLCIGDENGNDARCLPSIVAHILGIQNVAD